MPLFLIVSVVIFYFSFILLKKIDIIVSIQLRDIIASLPKKLVVFVTHHHRDHVNGMIKRNLRGSMRLR